MKTYLYIDKTALHTLPVSIPVTDLYHIEKSNF